MQMEMTEFEKTTEALTVTGAAAANADVNVEHYGFENTKPDKALISAEGYPAFRLHFVIAGSLTLYTNGRRVTLRKGSCFLLRPDADVAYKTNPSSPASFYWVSVIGHKCKTYFAEMGFGEEHYIASVPREYRRALRKAFFANFHFDENLKEIIDSVFLVNFLKIYQILYLAAHKNRAPKQEVPGKRKDYVEKTIAYINEHFSDAGLSIKEVARAIHIHENYLSRTFREEMGMTFREYLTQKRISVSYTMLEKGVGSIGDVAYKVGFSDALYFSKVFKRYNGVSPREHLKKLHSTPPRGMN